MFKRPSLSTRLSAGATTVAAALLLAACNTMSSPSPQPSHEGHDAMAGATQPDQSTKNAAQMPPASNLVTTATMTMSCVPTKEAQALGLVRTEDVLATYKMPPEGQAGDAVVELTFASKVYTLNEGPAASGSRYTTSDALSAKHKGFSWHSKRNEAIIAGLVNEAGVDEVVDGPLLYRCVQVN